MKTKIVLLVGPSGVGKDTLIKGAKKELKEDINFVRRYITRKPDKSEKNYYLDEYAFEILKNSSFFSSTWSAHGNYYGIAKNSIKKGVNIISISRSKIKDFEKNYDKVYTINITVPKEELRNRLLSRNRESLEEIEKRLSRSYSNIDAKNLIEYDNSSEIEKSIKKFTNLLKKIKSE
jgi:phosphonate metabolism protein PhnN/1,5-bisphosphokinase (PRPP-forming)